MSSYPDLDEEFERELEKDEQEGNIKLVPFKFLRESEIVNFEKAMKTLFNDSTVILTRQVSKRSDTTNCINVPNHSTNRGQYATVIIWNRRDYYDKRSGKIITEFFGPLGRKLSRTTGKAY